MPITYFGYEPDNIVYVGPADKTIEGHTDEVMLYFDNNKVWGPSTCHDNITQVQAAMAKADPRFELRINGKAKTVEGHTCTISVMSGGHYILRDLSCHDSLKGMAKVINDIWASSPP